MQANNVNIFNAKDIINDISHCSDMASLKQAEALLPTFANALKNRIESMTKESLFLSQPAQQSATAPEIQNETSGHQINSNHIQDLEIFENKHTVDQAAEHNLANKATPPQQQELQHSAPLSQQPEHLDLSEIEAQISNNQINNIQETIAHPATEISTSPSIQQHNEEPNLQHNVFNNIWYEISSLHNESPKEQVRALKNKILESIAQIDQNFILKTIALWEQKEEGSITQYYLGQINVLIFEHNMNHSLLNAESFNKLRNIVSHMQIQRDVKTQATSTENTSIPPQQEIHKHHVSTAAPESAAHQNDIHKDISNQEHHAQSEHSASEDIIPQKKFETPVIEEGTSEQTAPVQKTQEMQEQINNVQSPQVPISKQELQMPDEPVTTQHDLPQDSHPQENLNMNKSKDISEILPKEEQSFFRNILGKFNKSSRNVSEESPSKNILEENIKHDTNNIVTESASHTKEKILENIPQLSPEELSINTYDLDNKPTTPENIIAHEKQNYSSEIPQVNPQNDIYAGHHKYAPPVDIPDMKIEEKI